MWFVTTPNAYYHTPCSQNEKVAQIRRHFGNALAEHVIFSTKKYEVPGMYLIDDNTLHPGQEPQAVWKAILVDWTFNKHVECKRRLNVQTCIEDFSQIYLADNGKEITKLE